RHTYFLSCSKITPGAQVPDESKAVSIQLGHARNALALDSEGGGGI
ncbi:MAG: hypothetical protein ACI8QZ_004245, partial [Chlamydiales bacterium]